MDDLLKLLRIPTDSPISFLEFWGLIEQTVTGGAVEDDGDDIRCLRLLRDRVLREVRLGPTGRSVPHRRLMSILKEVHDTSSNKAVWEEAINSMISSQGGGASSTRLHSLETLSSAIKTMLGDYLQDDVVPVPVLNPPPPVSEKDDQIQRELDALRAALTESECLRSAALEESKRLREKQIEDKKSKPILVDASVDAIVSEGEERYKMMSEMNSSSLDKKQEEISLLQVQCNSVQEQLEKLQVSLAEKDRKIASFATPLPSFFSSQLPSISDWNVIQTKLRFLMDQVGETPEIVSGLQSVDSLAAQVQTLEVLKNDADAEITRLRNQLDEMSSQKATAVLQTFSIASPPRQQGVKTVSVHNFPPRDAAVDFVRPTTVKSSSSSSSKRPSGGLWRSGFFTS